MKKIGLVLSVLLLTGCASTASQDRPDDRYVFSLKSVDSSVMFLSSTLPGDAGYGEGVLITGFSSYVAEMDKTLGFVMLEVKPVYRDTSMDLLLKFEYCDGVESRNAVTSCVEVLDTYQESFTYKYAELPTEATLDNGLQFEVGEFKAQ